MQAGNEEAFTALYRHYSPRLYLNLLGMLHDPLVAEEIVQELFTKIWQKREIGALQENFAGYVYRTAQHLVHDFFRKLKRDRLLQAGFRALVEENYEHVEEALYSQQSSAILKKAIDQLSPQQKKVYELVKLEGYSYKKASEVLHISPLTVKEYLVASNKAIRTYVVSHMDGMPGLLLLLLIGSSVK
jgi:RNA polymerase sigma-70 factor (ECF subfamily)